MNLHRAKSKKKNSKFNTPHRKLNLKLFASLAILVMVPLFLVGLNSAALTSKVEACNYIPSWLITVNNGQTTTQKYFSEWTSVEPFLVYVEQQSIPNPGEHITLTISDGGSCLDGTSPTQTVSTSSYKCPTSVMPTSGPAWNLTMCNINGLLLQHSYTHWWQRFGVMDTIAQNSDTHPVYGNPAIFTYTDLTVTGP